MRLCVYGGGGLGQRDPAFGEAPCLMGGRGVNSAAPKLYLIFIHMNARQAEIDYRKQIEMPGTKEGLRRGKHRKALKGGGGAVHVSMIF